MSREKSVIQRRKRRKRVLKQAKGYFSKRKNSYRVARQAVMRALQNAYVDRKRRKRDFRGLWITRINAAARQNGLSYSKLIHGLSISKIKLNRKVLADMAVRQPEIFSEITKTAKESVNGS
ncbi:MAG: 50S ribosomal protein L20 [candidate division WOR-3 bacterium]|jgi:large subunit ribosomal protein L20